MIMMRGNEHPEERVPLYKPEQKLRERLAKTLVEMKVYQRVYRKAERGFVREELTQKMLALIEEALPVLNKEAGYKSLEEVTEFGLSVHEAAYLQGKAEGRAGYVKLAENQTPPENPFDTTKSGLENSAYNAFEVARLRYKGWRKVELEVQQ